MRKRFVSFSIVLLGLLISCVSGYSIGRDRDKVYQELDLFAEAMAVVEKRYAEDVLPKELVYGAVEGMLMSLDSYSQFLKPEDLKDLMVDTEGKFGGLGIEITLRNKLLTIVSPIEDTPAWRAGLQAGDIIVKIDGAITENITLQEAVDKMRGEPGTKVNITVLRESDRSLSEYTIERAIIKLHDIKRAMMLDDGIAYARISDFRERTSKDLLLKLKELSAEGMRALILDVRNNPGGLLNSAVDISSLFVEKNGVIVSTKSRSESEEVFKAKGGDKFLDIPVVVLINRGSASGSEILAAALRENNRAVLLGETTFGKGCVQTVMPLSDGSALKLTTSKYYTPSGESIHEKGIAPDIEVEYKKLEVEKNVFDEVKEKEEKNDKLVNETAKSTDDIKEVSQDEADSFPADEFNYRADYQILRAMDLLRGLLVISSSEKGHIKVAQGQE
ncbi:MAG: S41 family peptidase [Candidatus Omnitrophica bacterium]|nr:S41 family peptidase [Candidatus Omnitrophota bacterium]